MNPIDPTTTQLNNRIPDSIYNSQMVFRPNDPRDKAFVASQESARLRVNNGSVASNNLYSDNLRTSLNEIDASGLATSTPSIQSVQTPQTDPTATYKSALSSIPTYQDIQNSLPSDAQAQSERSSLMDRLTGLLGKSAEKTQFRAQQEVQAGIPNLQKQLMETSSQINALKNEAGIIPMELQNQIKGQGVTEAGLAPIQADRLRENAIKALTLNSVAQTLQGNYAVAQESVDRAVNMKFQPIEDEINILKQQYEINKDTLTGIDKRRTEALKIQLDDRQRQLTEQKEAEKTKLGFIAEAAKNGASSFLINEATKANSPEEALSILSPYMQDPNQKLLDLEKIKYQKAQTQKIYAEIDDIKKDISKTDNPEKVVQELKAKKQESLAVYTLVDELTKDTGYLDLAGPLRPVGSFISGTEVQKKNNQFKQLKALLSLENRQKLKGSGAVSDYESKVLAEASSSLGDAGFGTNLGYQDFADELAKIKGVAATAAGLQTKVRMTNPKTGETADVTAGREGIEQAVMDGMQIQYFLKQ